MASAANSASNILSAGGCDDLDRMTGVITALLAAAVQGTLAHENATSLSTENVVGSSSRTDSGEVANLLHSGIDVNLPAEALLNHLANQEVDPDRFPLPFR